MVTRPFKGRTIIVCSNVSKETRTGSDSATNLVVGQRELVRREFEVIAADQSGDDSRELQVGKLVPSASCAFEAKTGDSQPRRCSGACQHRTAGRGSRYPSRRSRNRNQPFHPSRQGRPLRPAQRLRSSLTTGEGSRRVRPARSKGPSAIHREKQERSVQSVQRRTRSRGAKAMRERWGQGSAT